MEEGHAKVWGCQGQGRWRVAQEGNQRSSTVENLVPVLLSLKNLYFGSQILICCIYCRRKCGLFSLVSRWREINIVKAAPRHSTDPHSASPPFTEWIFHLAWIVSSVGSFVCSYDTAKIVKSVHVKVSSVLLVNSKQIPFVSCMSTNLVDPVRPLPLMLLSLS